MRQYIKTVLKGALLLTLAFVCTMQMGIKAEAKYVDDAANGVGYDDEITVDVGYASQYCYGGDTTTSIYLQNSGDRVSNVKSSSSNLLAKKTRESYNYITDVDWETNATTTTQNYRSASISYFAKKGGNYTVTFDVVKADGTVRCTKTIKVKTSGSSTSANPVKSIKFAGKELFNYYPYSTKTSGTLKVTMNKGYQMTSIEIGKRGNNGSLAYNKTKNNKKITLAKQEVYSYDYSSSGGSKYAYDELFPQTIIKINYKNKKTGEIGTYVTYLHTMNKKQSW